MNAPTNTFSCNGLDSRVGKVDSAGTATYLRDGAGVTARRSGSTKFVNADRLGSTTRLTDATEATTDTREYDAYGLTVSSTGSTATPFGFVGKAGYQQDADSGLMLLGHRYYDASTGRFITRDHAKDGKNWFAYVRCNPLKGIDPTGLQDPSSLFNSQFNSAMGNPDQVLDSGESVLLENGGRHVLSWAHALSDTWQFFWGVGKTERNYDPNSIESTELKYSALGRQIAREVDGEGNGYRSLKNSGWAFLNTIFEPVNGTQAKVGGVVYKSKRIGGAVYEVTVKNKISVRSLAYHWLGLSGWEGWNRAGNGFGPYGTVTEYYRFEVVATR